MKFRSKLIHCYIVLCVAIFRQHETKLHAKAELSTIQQPKLALVLCGQAIKNDGNSIIRQINQTITLIKSVLITTEKNETVHIILIITQKKHYETIKSKVKNWDNRYKDRLTLEFVHLKYPRGYGWLKNGYRPCSTFNIFLADILPYDAVIYTDTDILFLRSIQHLWSEFFNFNSTSAIGASVRIEPSSEKLPMVHGNGLGVGVMIMNLTRMRQKKISQKAISMSTAYLRLLKHWQEDMLSIYFHSFPDQFYKLTCDWSYTPQRCSFPCEGNEIRGGVSILHGNFFTFSESGDEKMFWAVYDVFENTDLTSGPVDLDDLLRRLKSALQIEKNSEVSPCSVYDEFEDLVIRRFQQKLAAGFPRAKSAVEL